MSYDTPLDEERRDRAPAFQTPGTTDVPGRCTLAVGLQAGVSALPRLLNLMSKLDIEPVGFHAKKSVCGQRLTVTIDLGADHEAMSRLELRLKGMVTVIGAERIPPEGQGLCAQSPVAPNGMQTARVL